MNNENVPCPEFPHFGAHYPDATCINGFLWDLDSCGDDHSILHHGGEDPCPFCNTEAYLEWAGVGDPDGPTREEILIRIENTRKRYS